MTGTPVDQGHAHTTSSIAAPRRWSSVLWGGALIALGLVWLLDRADVLDASLPAVLAIGVIVVGLVVPFVGHADRGGVVALGITLSALAATTLLVQSVVDGAPSRTGIGDVAVRPMTAQLDAEGYGHGIGQLTVDLRRVDVTSTTTTSAQLGVGVLRLRLPAEQAVRVTGRVGVGEVVGPGQQRGGVGSSLLITTRGRPGDDVLEVDASVGIGRIEVTR